MQQPPLSVILSWPEPNYIDPETRGYANVILNIILYAILLSFVGLRIWTRKWLKNAFGKDDTFILLALVPTTGFFIISILKDTKYLWIRHTYDIPVSHVTGGLKMVLAAEVTFAAAITLTKLSMLMLVRRLLVNSSLLWRRVTLAAIVVVTIQGSVFCLTVIFQCRPIHDYWKVTTDPQPNCISQPATLLAAGIINTFTDLATVLLPIRTVWTLQLPTRQMVVVIMLFGFGFISCIAGVVRTYYMYEVTTGWDQTWRSYPVWITSSLELYIGIICASIPATKPFFSTYLPALFGSMTGVSSGTSKTSRRGYLGYSQRSEIVTPGGGEELLDLEKSLGGVGKRGINMTVVSREDRPVVRGRKGSQESEGAESREGILVVQTFEMSGR
ncbi:integral membrane protein [Rhexocercosporidium sp. MPI-PUGE-AT-0058]|nr:integral membrane protein [Rhexocercosporidium sp. MPI-PUGE-AT-0058]